MGADISPTTAGKSPAPAGGTRMSTLVEARMHVSDIAGPLRLGENVKAALARVARATGLPPRRVRGLWHGEAKLVSAEEMDRLRIAAARAKADATLRNAAHGDLEELLRRISACETALRIHPADRGRQVDHA